MGKTRILYALESAGGGTLKHVTYLATRLNQNEFDITVVLPDTNYENDTNTAVMYMQKKGVRVHILAMKKNIALGKDIYTLCRIYSYLKKSRFDIVHTHSSKAGFLFRVVACVLSVPAIVHTPHCFYFTACPGIKRQWFACLERMLARITHVIVISGTERIALHKAHITPKKTIEIIDNAIDPDEYKITQGILKKQLDIPEDHTVVIGVGRLVKQKNWELFIHAAKIVLASYRAVSFVIAGNGTYHSRLSDLTEQLGIASQVKLCGYLDDISQIYSIADLFVSASEWEGLPYTYLEATHYGIPVLITRTEGMEYFIRQTGCDSVSGNNSQILGSKIIGMLMSPCGKTASCQAAPFSIHRFIERHEALYRQLVHK